MKFGISTMKAGFHGMGVWEYGRPYNSTEPAQVFGAVPVAYNNFLEFTMDDGNKRQIHKPESLFTTMFRY